MNDILEIKITKNGQISQLSIEDEEVSVNEALDRAEKENTKIIKFYTLEEGRRLLQGYVVFTSRKTVKRILKSAMKAQVKR